MKYTIFICFLMFSRFALADSFYVQDPVLVGVNKEEGSTIAELVRAAVTELHHEVTTKSGDADYVLKPRVLRLGSAYVLTIEKVKGGKSKFSSQMKAEKMEEIDNVVARVVRAVIAEAQINGDARVQDVTQNEVNSGTKRRETINRWYFGLGPSTAVKTAASGTLFNWALGYYWEVTPTAAVKVVYDGTSDRFNYLALGGNYYFTDRDQSPLVTAEFGYGSAVRRPADSYYTETTSGFVLGAGVGYQIFRTSKVNLELLLHGALLMASNSEGSPGKFGVRLGLYW